MMAKDGDWFSATSGISQDLAFDRQLETKTWYLALAGVDAKNLIWILKRGSATAFSLGICMLEDIPLKKPYVT